MIFNDELYKILGVKPDATPEEIKKAYREKVSEHHPDKGGDQEEFIKVQEAYEILSDPNKRAEYDRTGNSNQDRQAAQIRQAACNRIQVEFVQAIQKAVEWKIGIDPRLFEKFKDKIKRERSNCQSTVTEIESKIADINKMRGEIELTVEGTTNLFIITIEQMLDNANRLLNEQNMLILQFNEVEKLVESYRVKPRKELQPGKKEQKKNTKTKDEDDEDKESVGIDEEMFKEYFSSFRK